MYKSTNEFDAITKKRDFIKCKQFNVYRNFITRWLFSVADFFKEFNFEIVSVFDAPILIQGTQCMPYTFHLHHTLFGNKISSGYFSFCRNFNVLNKINIVLFLLLLFMKSKLFSLLFSLCDFFGKVFALSISLSVVC